MAQQWFVSPSSRPARSLDIIRVVVALLLSVHSIYRMIKGDVSGFGEYLGSVGLPLGVALAWFITISTFISSVALIINRLIVPACLCHIIVLLMGILLDHRHDGWFVVGGGRNGMEYSVLLIACLSAIVLSHWPQKK
jgi:putative oxidoreductase